MRSQVRPLLHADSFPSHCGASCKRTLLPSQHPRQTQGHGEACRCSTTRKGVLSNRVASVSPHGKHSTARYGHVDCSSLARDKCMHHIERLRLNVKVPVSLSPAAMSGEVLVRATP